MITFEKVKSVFPSMTEGLFKVIQEQMSLFGISSDKQQAMFLAQCGHESGGFKIRSENLNYSAQGLLKTFPKYFNQAQADLYQRKPEKIANRVYANRMGNRDEASGDGWKYRGKGFIQLTGKENYTSCGAGIGVDLVNQPEYLLTDIGAIQSACWFWNSRNLNQYADKDDIVGCTKKINGGKIGLEERTRLYHLLCQ